jgi:hypothetical protein
VATFMLDHGAGAGGWQWRHVWIREKLRRQPTACMIVLLLAASVLAACSGKNPTPAAEVAPTRATTATPIPAANPTTAPATGLAPTAVPNTVAAPITNPTTTPTTPATSTAAPTTAPLTAAGDPRQAVLNALHAMAQAGAYRVHSTTTTDEGNTIQISGEVILPDRFHLVMNGREILIIGNKTGDQWTEFPVDVGSIVSGFMGGMTAEMEKSISDVESVGPDTVNGVPAQVYQYTSSFKAGDQEVKGTAKLWVGVANGLPIQQEVDGEFAGIKSKTVQEIEYDPSIKIEAPAQ